MKYPTGKWVVWAMVLALLSFPAGCKKELTPEEKARELLENARALYEEGKTLEALGEYDKLTEYNSTPAYAEAEEFLTREGYLLGDGLNSWTIKKMFEIENEILGLRPEELPIKGLTVRHPVKDAWGHFFNIEYSGEDRYSFTIISAGLDTEFGTDDDLSLPHGIIKKPAAEEPADPAVEAEPPEEETPDELYQRVAPSEQFMKEALDKANPPPAAAAPTADQGRPPPAPSPKSPIKIGPTGERTVDLEDLLELEKQGKK